MRSITWVMLFMIFLGLTGLAWIIYFVAPLLEYIASF